jgi:DNA-binding NtrC family response regulator
MKKRILAIDDDPLVRELIRDALEQDYKVRTAASGREGMALLDEEAPDLLLLDIGLPDADGLELLQRIRKHPAAPVVIIMTANSSVEGAVEAMQRGAFHYLTKPLPLRALRSLIERATEMLDLRRENRQLRHRVTRQFGKESIIGRSPEMQAIFDTIEMVAESRSTVLIQGPTGTGKELIAMAIHYSSTDRDGPLIKVNCAALPSNLLESELFGHEKGAFTGAEQRQIGKFELADGGSILLDEISEIDPPLQAKLLRVLQEREFYRVGGKTPVRPRCRILATTNRPLQQEVRRGAFREDLYYRLNVVPIEVPPLRQRPSDIPLLIGHFLRHYNREFGKKVEFTEDVIAYLAELRWPGNVRELENFIERAVVMSRNDLVALSNVLIPDPEEELARDESTTLPIEVGMSVREVERLLILETLEVTGWNRTRAAEMLGISIRTLRNKLHEYRAAGAAAGRANAGGERE